ncbi:MAG: hypothetical protein EAX81_04670 [Candidatus Thorarchaeota archaeon]|nr:hypothetical protein [Candidatus Thorarchaeota archaeon]
MIVEMPSVELAERNAQKMRNCPRLILSGFTSNFAYNLFIISERERWWAEYPAEHPEVLGAKSVHLEIVENLLHPDESRMSLPVERFEVAPCGSDCGSCPSREEFDCQGCPATIHYIGTE